MAEELKEEFEGDRTKGFVSISNPYVYVKDEQDDDIKQILGEHNYQDYVDSLDESQFNSKGVPPYFITFYEVQDQESPCSFFPEDIKSSDENEVSATEWNLYSSCCRISKSRYIITGGISLDSEYMEVFSKKFELIQARKDKLKEIQSYIELLQSKVEGETEDAQRIRLLIAIEKGSQIKQTAVEWKNEGDFEKLKGLFVQVFQNEMTKIKLKYDKDMLKLDRDYCKENNIEYKFKEDLSPDALIFNMDSPYTSKAIEVVFKFNPLDEKYEFTATYIEPLPVSISNHQSVFHKGKVYVIGGVCKQTIQKTVFAYDILDKTWSEVPSMNLPRVNSTAVSHGDYIYVLGGHTVNYSETSFDFTTIERYNPSIKQESWEKLTFKKKMGYTNYLEHQLKLVSYKDQLMLIGGGAMKKDIENVKENTQVFKIELLADNKWQLVPLESSLIVRKGEVVSQSTYRGKECFYIYGGLPQLQLECFKFDVENNQISFEKILDCDYTEEINSFLSDHIVCQPTLFLD